MDKKKNKALTISNTRSFLIASRKSQQDYFQLMHLDRSFISKLREGFPLLLTAFPELDFDFTKVVFPPHGQTRALHKSCASMLSTQHPQIVARLVFDGRLSFTAHRQDHHHHRNLHKSSQTSSKIPSNHKSPSPVRSSSSCAKRDKW